MVRSDPLRHVGIEVSRTGRKTRWGAMLLTVGAALGLSGAAFAQNLLAGNGAGMDTHLFRPAMDSKGLFTTNGSDILGQNDFSFGLVLDYGNTLLRVPNSAQQSSSSSTLVPGDVPVQLRPPQPLRRRPRHARRPRWRATRSRGGRRRGRLPGVGDDTSSTRRRSASSPLHAKWRITRVEHGFGLALGVQVGGSR